MVANTRTLKKQQPPKNPGFEDCDKSELALSLGITWLTPFICWKVKASVGDTPLKRWAPREGGQ